jgi:hypothetical protein
VKEMGTDKGAAIEQQLFVHSNSEDSREKAHTNNADPGSASQKLAEDGKVNKKENPHSEILRGLTDRPLRRSLFHSRRTIQTTP